MRWNLRSLLAVVILLAVVVAVSAQMKARARRLATVTACVSNLANLWKLQHNYMVRFGGESRVMARESGGDFWLLLSRTSPPLIDATLHDLYRCRVRGAVDRRTDYRGPVGDVNECTDGDVVGADIDGNHGRGAGGNVLRKCGDVQSVGDEDPLWINARSKTRE